VLIARLAGELRCYEPERADAVWARLRHLGARRCQLTTGATAAVNQIRDLLESRLQGDQFVGRWWGHLIVADITRPHERWEPP
jgi:hypothetical protein